MNVRAPCAPEKSFAGTAAGTDEGHVGQLIRSLLLATACITGDAPTSSIDNDGDEVLLDIDVDGCRYLLMRLPQLDPMRASLSPREQEIARMVAAGHPSKAIAQVLNISSWTVGTHLRRIFAKLGVKSRAAMVGRLHEVGIVVHARSVSADASHGGAAAAPIGERRRA
ncbi:response regulator transcription factor [Rhizobacter sp. P5_C2]